MSAVAVPGTGFCEVEISREDVPMEELHILREQRRSKLDALRERYPNPAEFAEAFIRWREEERATVTVSRDRQNSEGNEDNDERFLVRELPADASPSVVAWHQLRTDMIRFRESIASLPLDERRVAMMAWRMENHEKIAHIADLRNNEAAESKEDLNEIDPHSKMPAALRARFELRDAMRAEWQAIVDRFGPGQEAERARLFTSCRNRY